MTLVTLAADDIELVQCADCQVYAILDEAADLEWVFRCDDDWRCASCFDRAPACC